MTVAVIPDDDPAIARLGHHWRMRLGAFEQPKEDVTWYGVAVRKTIVCVFAVGRRSPYTCVTEFYVTEDKTLAPSVCEFSLEWMAKHLPRPLLSLGHPRNKPMHRLQERHGWEPMTNLHILE